MIVGHRGGRWEIDAVEFWEWDEKLTLRALDGADEGKRREVWAAAVTFLDEIVPLKGEAPRATGGHEQ